MITNNGQIVKVHTERKLDTNTMGYLKMEKFLKEPQYIQEEQNMSVNLKIMNHMDMEPSSGQTAINTMENGKMVKVMVMELKYGLMEENI